MTFTLQGNDPIGFCTSFQALPSILKVCNLRVRDHVSLNVPHESRFWSDKSEIGLMWGGWKEKKEKMVVIGNRDGVYFREREKKFVAATNGAVGSPKPWEKKWRGWARCVNASESREPRPLLFLFFSFSTYAIRRMYVLVRISRGRRKVRSTIDWLPDWLVGWLVGWFVGSLVPEPK